MKCKRAKVIMLPTEKDIATIIKIGDWNNKLHHNTSKVKQTDFDKDETGYHLYITRDDEIKELPK